MAWFNSTLDLSLSKVEEACSGARSSDRRAGSGGNGREDGGSNQGRRNPLSFLWPFRSSNQNSRDHTETSEENNRTNYSGLANKKTLTIQPGGKDQSVLLATTRTKKQSKPASLLNKLAANKIKLHLFSKF